MDSNLRSLTRRSRSSVAAGELPGWSNTGSLEMRCPSHGGPRVRIHLPPAESQSLGRIRVRESRTPAFRAGVRGWLGDAVGRDRRAFQFAPTCGNISVGPYSSTAV